MGWPPSVFMRLATSEDLALMMALEIVKTEEHQKAAQAAQHDKKALGGLMSAQQLRRVR